MNNFAELRKAAGMTQAELAEELKIDRSTVAKWETGEAQPRVKTLMLLAEKLNCSADDLLRVKEESA